MKPTKKKKKTYVITTSVLGNLSLFGGCKSTPLVVVELNGKKINQGTGWHTGTEFPNPAASNMVGVFDKLEPVMGTRLASTIVEYLDKETNEPVAMLFPTNEIMYREDASHDFTSRLNHATRQDLKHQMSVREKYLKKLAENQNQK